MLESIGRELEFQVNAHKLNATYRVVVGGSRAARERYPVREYKLRSSAKRRQRQIHDSHDLGVSTIWLLIDVKLSNIGEF